MPDNTVLQPDGSAGRDAPTRVELGRQLGRTPAAQQNRWTDMMRLWRGITVGCFVGAMLQSSLALSVLVKGIRVVLRGGPHLPVLRDGSTMVELAVVVSIPGVLFGLSAYARLRESSPRFAELAATATLCLLGGAMVLIGLSASPLVELH